MEFTNKQTNKLCLIENGKSFQSFMMMKTRALNVLPIVPLGVCRLRLWYLTPFSTYFSYIVVVRFIGARNHSTW